MSYPFNIPKELPPEPNSKGSYWLDEENARLLELGQGPAIHESKSLVNENVISNNTFFAFDGEDMILCNHRENGIRYFNTPEAALRALQRNAKRKSA